MKEFISWEQYQYAIDRMVLYYKQSTRISECGAVYGLPRGGLPIAVSLSHKLDLPLLMNYYDRKIVTDKKILVVDDIADTGNTLKDFDNDHNLLFTIHYHSQSVTKPDFWVWDKKDKWIVYPWETEDSDTIQDYLVGEMGEAR